MNQVFGEDNNISSSHAGQIINEHSVWHCKTIYAWQQTAIPALLPITLGSAIWGTLSQNRFFDAAQVHCHNLGFLTTM